MHKTKIQAISKSKTIDYGDKEVANFWLKINDKSNYKDNNNLEQIIAVFNDIQEGVICVQTEILDHPKIITAIYTASKKRNRIYILTNEKDKDLEQIEGVCLVRYGIKNIGSFVLTNPSTNHCKGMIYTAPFMETSLANAENISLELDKEQVKTLFRFFADNFWNKAKFEIIENFNNPQETGEPPLDFLPNIKDFCDADFVKNELSKINSNTIISVPTLQTNDLINLSSLRNSKILTSLENNDDLLKTTAINENSIKAISNFNTTRIIISENANNWLIPKTNIPENSNLFALKLNKAQTNKLEKLIKTKIENAELEFSSSKKRKELKYKTIRLLASHDNEIVIKQKTEKMLNDIELKKILPKDEFENQEPEFIDDGVSITVNYQWRVVPFHTPGNAKKAKLYEDWEKYQNEYDTFLKQIENAINESENKNIGEKLKRWFLGKQQAISKFQNELNELKNENLSIIAVAKRKEVIKKLNRLAKNVSANLSEIDNAIKKSGIKTEIENLKKQKEQKEIKLNNFIEKQKDKLKEIGKSKEIEGFDFRKKFEDEKQKIEKEIKHIESKIKSKEKNLEQAGKEQQQNESSSLNSVFRKGQNNKNSKQNNEFSIPENTEYLPKIGKLFEIGKQKYLEIEFWEDYQTALEEASRLNAKLSAKQL